MKKIIVADDDPSCLKLYERIFDGILGSLNVQPEIEYVQDGLTLFNRIVTNPADYGLIISDNTMPNLSGLEVAIGMRQKGIKIPIAILSGDLFIKQEVLKIEEVTFIEKPIKMEDLQEMIKQYCISN